MAPVQTLSWVIPAQTVLYVATLLGNSTQWQQKSQSNSDSDTVDIFVVLCFIAMGIGYWVGLTKRLEDGDNVKQENQVSEDEVSKDIENGENVTAEVSVRSKHAP